MFGFLKQKSPEEKLQIKYRKLLEESYQLSTSNRRASDDKRAQAEDVLKEIEALRS